MGVRGHGDWLRGKYVTALISDYNDRAYAVPIRHTIGNYFVADIDGTLYAFTLEGARILTIGDVASRQARFVLYDVSHFKALDARKLQGLARCLERNGLGKVDRVLLRLFSLMGRAEAKQEQAIRRAIERKKKRPEWQAHTVASMTALIDQHAELWPEEAAELRQYLSEIDMDQIVTPVRKISEFLHADLLQTDPSFLGELFSRASRIDRENRTMTNTPKTSGMAWLKWALLMGMAVGVIMVVGIGAQEGWFSGLTLGLDQLDFSKVGQSFNPTALQSMSGGGGGAAACDAAAIEGRYASPLDLKIAVQSGAETCPLPDSTQKMIDAVEGPRIANATTAP